jgi:hypothetical protein
VNAKSPGRGTFVQIAAMNHHFWLFPTAADAFNEANGTVNPDPAVTVMLRWLQMTFDSAGASAKDV